MKMAELNKILTEATDDLEIAFKAWFEKIGPALDEAEKSIIAGEMTKPEAVSCALVMMMRMNVMAKKYKK